MCDYNYLDVWSWPYTYVIIRSEDKMAWKKGCPSPNPKGRPRLGSALAEAIRERADVHEMVDIALAIARGEPQVRVLDRKTGKPRLAESPSRNRAGIPGDARPVPISQIDDDATIHEIVWTTRTEMMAALTWLATMGGMKPPTEIETTVHHDEGSTVIDFERLSPAELDAYVALVDKAAGGGAQSLGPGEIIDVEEVEK